MGENDEDIIDLAYAVRELEIDSIPVNFLLPIAGTPLETRRDFAPTRGLKTLCLLRLLNPQGKGIRLGFASLSPNLQPSHPHFSAP